MAAVAHHTRKAVSRRADPFHRRWLVRGERPRSRFSARSTELSHARRNQPSFQWLPYLKHVVNEVDEGPKEKGRAVGRIVLHCLVCQPGKENPIACP